MILAFFDHFQQAFELVGVNLAVIDKLRHHREAITEIAADEFVDGATLVFVFFFDGEVVEDTALIWKEI